MTSGAVTAAQDSGFNGRPGLRIPPGTDDTPTGVAVDVTVVLVRLNVKTVDNEPGTTELRVRCEHAAGATARIAVVVVVVMVLV